MLRPPAFRCLAVAAIAGIAGAGVRVDAQNEATRRRMIAATVRIINEHPVIVRGEETISTGSGVLLGHGEYVATNWHVVDANRDGRFDGPMTVAAIVDGKVRTTQATEVWHAEPLQRDVIILRLAEPFPYAAPSISLSAAQADQVWAVGFPGVSDDFTSGTGGRDQRMRELLQPTMNLGTIARVNESAANFGGARVIQHQVPLNHGNSGGPLFDACGSLVGLNVAITEAQGTNFSIHVAELDRGLRARGIPFTTTSHCDSQKETVTAGGTPWPIWLALALSMAVAGTALAMSMTPRGRAVVRQVSQRWSPSRAMPPVPTPQHVPPVPMPPPVPRASGGRLRCLSGEFAGLELEISDELITLGRDPMIRGLVFLSEPSSSISKRHCELRYDPAIGRVTLTDLNSSNGTFAADGSRLAPYAPRALRDGDRFYLASKSAMFELSQRGD